MNIKCKYLINNNLSNEIEFDSNKRINTEDALKHDFFN